MKKLIKETKNAKSNFNEAKNKLDTATRKINSKLLPIIESMCRAERNIYNQYQKENPTPHIPNNIKPIMYPHFIDIGNIQYKDDDMIIRYGNSYCGESSYMKVKIPTSYLDMSTKDVEHEHEKYCVKRIPELMSKYIEETHKKNDKADLKTYLKLKEKFEK